MGKATYKGLVPRDDPMFSTGPEVFSRLGSSESSRTSPKSTSGETPVESSSAIEPDPMQPAVDAIEEWGRKTFGGLPAVSQEAHDLWLQRQSPKQVKVLASNLGDLMLAREGRDQPIGDDLADPAGMGVIEVPDKFPEGCEFVASFSGDEFVAFPDGKVFKASDDGESLIPVNQLPDRSAAPTSEEGFLSTCAKSREFIAREKASASVTQTSETSLDNGQAQLSKAEVAVSSRR